MVFRRCFGVSSVLLCALIVAVGVALAGEHPGSPVNCDIQQGACTQRIDGRRVTLDVTPRPVRAMTELTFRVTVEERYAVPVARIELNMLAMDMGENHVPLKLNPKGGYQGRGVIVRCRSGIRTWSARVVLPGLGVAEFVFDVIY